MMIKLINRRWYVNGEFVGGLAFAYYCQKVKTRPSELSESQVREFLQQANPQPRSNNA